MFKNVGNHDAFVRLAVAAALGLLSARMVDHPIASLLVAIVAIAIAASGLTRRCPLYVFFGMSTRSRSRATSAHK